MKFDLYDVHMELRNLTKDSKAISSFNFNAKWTISLLKH
jgi:hypothetical protein